jgi:hypothetical protein
MAVPLNETEIKQLKTLVNVLRRSNDESDQTKIASIRRFLPSLGDSTLKIDMARTFSTNQSEHARSLFTKLTGDDGTLTRPPKRSATAMNDSENLLEDPSLDNLIDMAVVNPANTEIEMPKKVRKTKLIESISLSIAQNLSKSKATQTVFDVVLQTVKAKILKFQNFESLARLGLTCLVASNSKVLPTIFLNGGPQYSKLYSPYLSTHLVGHSNTYTALFMLSFPVWVVITSKDTVFYVPTIEEINRLRLFNLSTTTFDIKRFLTAEPNFDNFHVFEASAQGDMLLSKLFTSVLLTYGALSMNRAECDFEVPVSTTDIALYESAALKVWQHLFQTALTKVFNETNNSLFVVMDSFMPGKVAGSFCNEITEELKHILDEAKCQPKDQQVQQQIPTAHVSMFDEVDQIAVNSFGETFEFNGFLHAENDSLPPLSQETLDSIF